MKKIINLDSADKVGKQYLIDHLMVEKKFDRDDAVKAVEGVIDALVAALHAGTNVNISNFGTLRVEQVAERVRRNPQTGGAVVVPANKTIRWTASPTLLDLINGRIDRDSLSVKAPKGSL